MPLVAMTREMGSLGKDVAAQLSERLGKPLVHHEIIGMLADKMRLRKSHVIRFLEGKAGIWERMTTDKTSLSIYTADETLKLVEQDRVAVIRGWGAAHLLRPVPHVVCEADRYSGKRIGRKRRNRGHARRPRSGAG